MPTEQCVFLILYIHSIYGILYITSVFLKLGESIYVAKDLIPILLGSLPLAHICSAFTSYYVRMLSPAYVACFARMGIIITTRVQAYLRRLETSS